MGKHAELPASAGDRWVNCAASVHEEKAEQEKHGKKKSSVYARLGTSAHYLLEQAVIKEKDAVAYLGRKIAAPLEDDEDIGTDGACWTGTPEWKKISKSDKAHYELFDVDQEMVDAVQVALDEVRSDPLGIGFQAIQTEKYVDLKEIDPRVGGTVDLHRQCLDGWVDLWDYKNGSGVLVEVENNTQLKIYAVGLVLNFFPAAKGVRATIIQPRAPHVDGPVRTTEWTKQELNEFIDTLKEAVKRIDSKKPPYKSGKWCKWCSIAYRCPSLAESAQNAAAIDFEDDPVPIDLPAETTVNGNDKLARVLHWAPMLDAYLRACEGAVLRELQQGRAVPGYKLVRKKKNRAFAVPDQSVVEVMKEAGYKEEQCFSEPKLKSPAQLDKLGKAAKAAVKTVTYIPKGELTVAPLSDPRDAVDPSEGLDLFEDGDEPELLES